MTDGPAMNWRVATAHLIAAELAPLARDIPRDAAGRTTGYGEWLDTARDLAAEMDCVTAGMEHLCLQLVGLLDAITRAAPVRAHRETAELALTQARDLVDGIDRTKYREAHHG
jgi:hypothetical protein